MTQIAIRGASITLSSIWKDSGGTLTNPTNPLVDIFNPSNVAVVTNAVPTSTGVGQMEYVYAVADDAPLGTWRIHWTGEVDGVEVEGDELFDVAAAGVVAFPSSSAPPCTAYATEADMCAPCTGLGYTFPSGLIDDMLEVASGIMFHLTGEQFEGACSDTVYPTCQQGRRGYGGWGFEHWRPGDPAAWNGNGTAVSGCGGCRQISLGGYPVTAITTVTIDGEVLDADAYQVEDSRWLTRTDGSCWPCTCTCGANDDFEVIYTFGATPPALLVKATADLACQLVLACSPDTLGDCVLPGNVSSVTRFGVLAEMIPVLAGMLADGSGIPSVNAAIQALNPDGRRGRAVVARADMGRAVRRITTP